MFGGVFNKTFDLLEKTMDVTYARHKAITSNVANAETPGYRAKDINFEQELQRQLGSVGSGVGLDVTHTNHISIGKVGSLPVQPVDSPSGAPGLDGNTVNLETEMVRLSENTLRYEISAKLMKRKFQGLMSAIKGGR
ncbi:hypothetical protein MNBD_DELTA01-1714 [hydrothermal vent metagenome]|uniref:Flagellar basal-body rod protein FlgB n=1 Tax=hydrothermal vent metagenome TaxID=652676 RepID=A0A3B0RL03_9ZZZZ